MKLFRRKSTWAKMTGPVLRRASAAVSTRSGLLAAGAALGLTAASSAVSSVRRKSQQ